MECTLTANNYTPFERRMFEVIPKDGSQITSDDLVTRFWDGFLDPPQDPRRAAMDTLRRLQDRVNNNSERFAIRSTEARGPIPLKIWIERKRR